MPSEPIDFVIAWVNGNDETWQRKKKKYEAEYSDNYSACWNQGSVRYRDWGTLRYWFRGVEQYAPWVNKIHFVTDRQIPEWLNISHPKLHIVYHEDFIPAEYLPTFNSHCIELNFHRIPGLAEHFVYFNDDMFLTAPVSPQTFFKNGLPCDTAVINPVQMIQNGIRAEINDMYVINKYFCKANVLRKHPIKWFNPRYGKLLIRTICMLPFHSFPGFYILHLPCSYCKQTYEQVWNAVPEILNETCKHRFRVTTDVNQWLFEYWQYVTGFFWPRSPKVGMMFEGQQTREKMYQAIKKQQFQMICCNDSYDIQDFQKEKERIIEAFNYILPQSSNFEICGGNI